MPPAAAKPRFATLKELLLEAAPTAREAGMEPAPGRKHRFNYDLRSIATLAHSLGLSPWSVYLWMKRGRVPPNHVPTIVANANGRVTLDDFHKYVYS